MDRCIDGEAQHGLTPTKPRWTYAGCYPHLKKSLGKDFTVLVISNLERDVTFAVHNAPGKLHAAVPLPDSVLDVRQQGQLRTSSWAFAIAGSSFCSSKQPLDGLTTWRLPKPAQEENPCVLNHLPVQVCTRQQGLLFFSLFFFFNLNVLVVPASCIWMLSDLQNPRGQCRLNTATLLAYGCVSYSTQPLPTALLHLISSIFGV